MSLKGVYLIRSYCPLFGDVLFTTNHLKRKMLQSQQKPSRKVIPKFSFCFILSLDAIRVNSMILWLSVVDRMVDPIPLVTCGRATATKSQKTQGILFSMTKMFLCACEYALLTEKPVWLQNYTSCN